MAKDALDPMGVHPSPKQDCRGGVAKVVEANLSHRSFDPKPAATSIAIARCRIPMVLLVGNAFVLASAAAVNVVEHDTRCSQCRLEDAR
jgi:hypothetical protein